MNRHLDTRSQHSDCRADGGNHRHCQCRTHCIQRILHAQWHFGQCVVIKQIVLGIRLIQRIDQRLIVFQISALSSPQLQLFLSDGSEHIFQALRHLGDFLVQCRVDASHLLLLWEAIVAGNYLSHQIAVEATDVAQVHGKLKGQSVAVGANWLMPVIIHLPPLLDDFGIWDSEVIITGGGR